MKPLEYYIHIPFCVKKCKYCDFLSFPCGSDVRKQYVNRLSEEIKRFDEKAEYQVSTVFIGGGTPSVLEPEETEQIMRSITEYHKLSSDAEITIESNPGTLTDEKLDCMLSNGINRLSLGVQSLREEELYLLGRIHTVQDFYDNYSLARKKGFKNINIDLMLALPGQTLEQWMETLQQATELEPEHISAYSLIIEEGTAFYDLYHLDDERKQAGDMPMLLPSEDTERSMYEQTGLFLKEKGYEQYEISNYAKKGKQCRHNIGYWQRDEYKGFGLGAASFVKEQRFSNTTNLNTYLNANQIPEMISLSVEEQMEETMFLGLRMMQGVEEKIFKAKFGKTIDQVYGKELERLKREGMLEKKEGYIRLTKRGIDLANYVMSSFINL